MKFVNLAAIIILSIASTSHADSNWSPKEGILIAQDNYDAYDPFADYSEFDEATDEEADIYFFKNGRFFSIGLNAGYRIFTDTYGQIFQSAPNFGLSLSYFFDLNLAMQVSYTTGDHKFNYLAQGYPVSGSLSVSGFSMDLKYYLNMQNITKGISKVNPYVFGGITQLSRELRRNDSMGTKKEGTMAFQMGIGTEFPIAKNKYHFGLEAIYQYVNFPDEGGYLTVEDGGGNPIQTNVRLNGDILRIQAVIGFNF